MTVSCNNNQVPLITTSQYHSHFPAIHLQGMKNSQLEIELVACRETGSVENRDINSVNEILVLTPYLHICSLSIIITQDTFIIWVTIEAC